MSGLQEREEKRKHSIIGAIIDNQTEINKTSANEIIIKRKEKEEIKSKRLNLVVKPSIYKETQKKCRKLGISMNECVNQFLENWVNT